MADFFIREIKVEEKERKDEAKSSIGTKKPSQKVYKVEDARRILPIIDQELKKKIDKADTAVKDKKDGIKKLKVGKFLLYKIENCD